MSTAQEALSGTTQEEQEKKILCLAVWPQGRVEHQKEPFQFPLYWLELEPGLTGAADEPSGTALGAALVEILADPLLETVYFDNAATRKTLTRLWLDAGFQWLAERQFLPGVTDNLARTVEEALSMKGFSKGVRVASGSGFLFAGETIGERSLEESAKYVYYHPLTDRFKVHDLAAIYNRYLRFPAVHLPESKPPEVVSLELSDEGLVQLSKERLLALTLEEMQTIRNWYRQDSTRAVRAEEDLPENPLDVELEVIAQTWSEHCKHKIFNATISHKETWPGGGRGMRFDSLYKSYIQKPTFDLMSVRKDLQ